MFLFGWFVSALRKDVDKFELFITQKVQQTSTQSVVRLVGEFIKSLSLYAESFRKLSLKVISSLQNTFV